MLDTRALSLDRHIRFCNPCQNENRVIPVCSQPVPSPPGLNLRSVFCSVLLPFPEHPISGLRVCSILDWCLPLCLMCLWFLLVVLLSEVSSFSLQSSIPLCECVMTDFSSHSTFGLCIVLMVTNKSALVYKFLCEHNFSFLLSEYLGLGWLWV